MDILVFLGSVVIIVLLALGCISVANWDIDKEFTNNEHHHHRHKTSSPPSPTDPYRFVIDIRGKRKVDMQKLCILFLEKYDLEFLRNIRTTKGNVTFTLIGEKDERHTHRGRPYYVPYNAVTYKCTCDKLIEIATSQENRRHERNRLTSKLREMVRVRDNYTCRMCGKEMFDNVGLQIDHIIPIALGGKTELNNLQVLCSVCNRKKSDKMPYEVS